MDLEALRQFLTEANLAGYAGGEEKKWLKEPDGSTTIPFAKGLWKSHDNFFGGEPYGGRTVVFFEGKPVWLMVYYGWVVEGVEAPTVYKVLRNALGKMPKDYPFRGPKEYIESENTYTNSWTGDLSRFSGEEKITSRGVLLYQANYLGGLVDQRRGV